MQQSEELKRDLEILRAKQQRALIRQSFTEWAQYRLSQFADGLYTLAPHHRLILSSVEQFLATPEKQVLLIFAPPGSAKSTYVSQFLPSWYLANHPRHNIIFATHNVELAERWGRLVRNDILLEANTLGIAVRQDNAAAARWKLEQGGEYLAVGAGVGISGYRADLGVGDDLFGSREDAYSELVRKKRWDWYLNDYSTRLKPGAKRILISTRWHEEDVAGRLLEAIENGRVTGTVISIPAVAEDADDPLGRKPGEYLWDNDPHFKYGDLLRQQQKEQSPMMWSALYQQRPAPEEGDYFKAEWLVPYEKPPSKDSLRIYGASDYAVTADGGDFTVHLVAGIDAEGNVWLLDLWRQRTTSDVWVERFCDMVRTWRPISWAEETGQIKAGVGPFLERRMFERNAMTYRQQFPTKGDKAVRAQAIRGRMALRGLRVPSYAPWLAAFRAELLGFPAGKHDDQVDALGLLGQLLMLPHVATVEIPKKPTHHVITVTPDGRYQSNMTIPEIVALKTKKRKERERGWRH